MQVEQIWHSFHEPLKKFIFARVGNQAAAEDILQNVFLKIFTHLGDLRHEQKLKSWLYQITRNEIIDYYRREKPTDQLPIDLPITIEETETNINAEFSACVIRFLQQLPDKYREALQLIEIEGYSQKHMSELLGISFSGAKSRVQRGRVKLREMLEACCRFERDRFGNILDYESRSCTENAVATQCNCK